MSEPETIDAETGEVVDVPSTVVVQPSVIPAPVAEPLDVKAALDGFDRYQQLQTALDLAMPESLITIRGKKFRKKSYWRAVATAFKLQVQLVSEQSIPGPEGDWGWAIVYRATAPNGAFADGDGCCMASEKASGQDSIHNVRAHAHTRSWNRAVSNCVGFGEVSFEEMPHEPVAPSPRQREDRSEQRGNATTWIVTGKQAKYLWAIAYARGEEIGIPKKGIEAKIRGALDDLGLESTKELTVQAFEALKASV